MTNVTMTFNGEVRNYVRVLHDLERSVFAPITRELLEVPGHPGAHLTGTRTGVRSLSVPIMIEGHDGADLQLLKEDLAGWLIHDEPKELKFSDEPDRTYYAVVEGEFSIEDIINHGKGEIKFLCPDPYKYGDEVSQDITGGRIVTNTGTAEAKPIIDLQVKEKVTYATVQSGAEDYMMIGVPAEADQEVVDTRKLILNETGTNLSKWLETTPEMGLSRGSISYDGSGIVPTSYGTGTGYHGPRIYTEVPLTKDFEVEIRGQLLANSKQVGRFGFLLLDDQLRQIAMTTAVDKITSSSVKYAEGRVGPFVDNFVNYPISSKNFKLSSNDFPAYLKITRRGSMFIFYVAKVNPNGTHTNRITRFYTTANKAYLGQLKYISIFFDILGTHPKAQINRIDYIKAYSVGTVTRDQTPYIAYPGDVITFNHVDKSIRINGIERTDLKDFGAKYFTLNKGDSLISIEPQEAFNANIRYKERFR